MTGEFDPDISIDHVSDPSISLVAKSLPLLLIVKILSLSITGFAAISLISKLLKEDILDAFSDQIILPVS